MGGLRPALCNSSLVLLLFSVSAVSAQTVTTIAGTGVAGFSGDGGPGVQAQINNPYGLTIGPDGALYFCEIGNHRVRRLDLRSRVISTVAGSGKKGYEGDGGPALEAAMNEPYEIRFDKDGNVFLAEMQNHVIRRIDGKTKRISTVAGIGTAGFGGDGGNATTAQLRQPHSIAFDTQGRLLICDIGNQRVRRLNLGSGGIETWLGGGDPPLKGPRAIFVTPFGYSFLALREGNAIYRVDNGSGTLSLLAGTGISGYTGDGGPAKEAKLSGPKGIAWFKDGLYIADTESHTIRRIDLKDATIRTIVGDGKRGEGPDGDPLHCRLARPHGVFVAEDGTVFIADSENHRIRMLK